MTTNEYSGIDWTFDKNMIKIEGRKDSCKDINYYSLTY